MRTLIGNTPSPENPARLLTVLPMLHEGLPCPFFFRASLREPFLKKLLEFV
jgi:hypothetical protein